MTREFDRPAAARDPHSIVKGALRRMWEAKAARVSVSVLSNENGDGGEHEDLGDLLANLMHWARLQGVDFDAALESARGHYDAEYTDPDDITLTSAVTEYGEPLSDDEWAAVLVLAERGEFRS